MQVKPPWQTRAWGLRLGFGDLYTIVCRNCPGGFPARVSLIGLRGGLGGKRAGKGIRMGRYQKLWAGGMLALWAAAAPARAEGPGGPVVVELFTSQGCASCPPADAILAELAARPDVLPLSLHVDYWDYIGWTDTFASPAFTARQKAYAEAARSRMLYTPQMIVAGHQVVPGYDGAAVAAAIAAAQNGAGAPLRLHLRKTNGQIAVEAELLDPAALPGPFWVQMIRYRPEETVEIARGENAGQSITYANIVTDWQRLAEWDGLAPLALSAPYDGPEAVAVIVQSAGPAAILAAARAD